MKRYNPECIDPNGFPAEMETAEDGEYVKLQDVIEWLHTQSDTSGRTMALHLVFDPSEPLSLEEHKDLMNKGYI